MGVILVFYAPCPSRVRGKQNNHKNEHIGILILGLSLSLSAAADKFPALLSAWRRTDAALTSVLDVSDLLSRSCLCVFGAWGRVFGRSVLYGDPHASHSSLPHLEESDVFCLTSRLGPDTILAALSCLLQASY